MLLLLSCATPDVWPKADAACGEFSTDCQAVLSAHFGLSEELAGLARTGLLEGLWVMAGMDLGEECPDWAGVGTSGAACLYNAAAEAVVRSEATGEAGYLSLEEGVLWVGEDMGYYSPVRVALGLAEGIAGGCGAAWVGAEGLTSCAGADCAVLFEASEVACP